MAPTSGGRKIWTKSWLLALRYVMLITIQSIIGYLNSHRKARRSFYPTLWVGCESCHDWHSRTSSELTDLEMFYRLARRHLRHLLPRGLDCTGHDHPQRRFLHPSSLAWNAAHHCDLCILRCFQYPPREKITIGGGISAYIARTGLVCYHHRAVDTCANRPCIGRLANVLQRRRVEFKRHGDDGWVAQSHHQHDWVRLCSAHVSVSSYSQVESVLLTTSQLKR
jgi:hypothetical protein